MLSRVIYGARISLTVALIAVGISFVLGVVIGGVAGYFGGFIDALTLRTIEIIRSFPEIPLFMTLSALLPRSEEHTSELQSLMRISYAVFCLQKKQTNTTT